MFLVRRTRTSDPRKQGLPYDGLTEDVANILLPPLPNRVGVLDEQCDGGEVQGVGGAEVGDVEVYVDVILVPQE